METDESIWPWEDRSEQVMPIFQPGDFREQMVVGEGLPVGEFYLRRSPYTIKYERKFQKFDDIVAYIGGFIEFVIIGASFISKNIKLI